VAGALAFVCTLGLGDRELQRNRIGVAGEENVPLTPALSGTRVTMSQQDLGDISQWQWALTAGFHIIFPSLTVGISMFLVVTYAAFMRTGNEVYLRLFRFWRRIFAIGFGLGVVSGIVLTYEFGLNWGGFARDVGPILGVIIGMEVVTAFFLEAGFLGLLTGPSRMTRATYQT
jgi:cytochrome bd-type quinol oxidase subunit 1